MTSSAASSPITVQHWADETWPLNSRQASEIVAEQALQGATTPIVAAPKSGSFGEKSLEDETMTPQNPSSQGDTTVFVSCENHSTSSALLEDGSSCMASPASFLVTSPGRHVRRAFIHDPYCPLTGIKLLCVCTCDTCRQRPPLPPFSGGESVAPSATTPAFTSYASAAPLMTPAVAMMSVSTKDVHQDQHTQHDLSPESPLSPLDVTGATLSSALQKLKSSHYQHPETSFTPYPTRSQLSEDQGVASSTVDSTMVNSTHPLPMVPTMIPAPAAGLCHGGGSKTSFMPPAPPVVKKFTSMIFNNEDERTEEKETCVAAAIFTIMARWYTKVQEGQRAFLPEAEFCPVVENYQTVDKWSVACHKWWTLHFSEKQQKFKPLPASKQVSLRCSSLVSDAVSSATLAAKLAEKKAKKNKKKALKRAARRESLRLEQTLKRPSEGENYSSDAESLDLLH